MTSGVFGAVLLGALLHASWNAFVKSGADKALDTALLNGMGALVALPVVAMVGLPDPAAWWYLALSAVVHVAYYVALAGAYRHGELSLTYPLMRGLAPVLVAVAAGALLGESLSPREWAAVVAVSAGVVALGLSPRGLGRAHSGVALRYAVANAAFIAMYTTIDGVGVRASGDPLAYVAALFVLNGLPYAALVSWRHWGAGRAARRYLAGRWRLALAGAAASAGSYGIALWAMTRAPVASVAALREASVLFAVLIGIAWLKEPFGVLRALGTLLIVAGAVGIRGA